MELVAQMPSLHTTLTAVIAFAAIAACSQRSADAQSDAGLSKETLAACAVSPLYPIGTAVTTRNRGYLALTDEFKVVESGTQLKIIGSVVEKGTCDYWPVEVIQLPDRSNTNLDENECCMVEIGDTGMVIEQVFNGGSDTERTNCDSSYPDVCIPSTPPDLDCSDLPFSDIRVIGDDPHRLDGPYDGSNPYEPDGIGCEWN